MTAQHAVRQGTLAAHNVAASFGDGERSPTSTRPGLHRRSRRRAAAGTPCGVPLSGPPAKVVARGYHLSALPANRLRTASEWLFTAVGSRPPVQLGLVPGPEVPLDSHVPEPAGHAGTS